MRGRDFLVVAQELLRGGTEAHFRSAAGRAYLEAAAAAIADSLGAMRELRSSE